MVSYSSQKKLRIQIFSANHVFLKIYNIFGQFSYYSYYFTEYDQTTTDFIETENVTSISDIITTPNNEIEKPLDIINNHTKQKHLKDLNNKLDNEITLQSAEVFLTDNEMLPEGTPTYDNSIRGGKVSVKALQVIFKLGLKKVQKM